MYKVIFTRHSFILITACLLISFVKAQSVSGLVKHKVYKININTKAGVVRGYLHNISDSSIKVSPDFIAFRDTLISTDSLFRNINYSSIVSISIKRQRTIGNGILIGGVTGAIVGLLTYQENTGLYSLDFGPESNAVIGGLVGGAVGALVGLLLRDRYFYINTDITKFQDFKSKIQPTIKEPIQ